MDRNYASSYHKNDIYPSTKKPRLLKAGMNGRLFGAFGTGFRTIKCKKLRLLRRRVLTNNYL